MRTRISFSILLLCISLQLSRAQSPLDSDINCETESGPPTLDYPLEPIGTTKILWIVCAPDSGALAPLDSLSIARPNPDSCGTQPRVRVMYPSTYSMPWWSDIMLDTSDERSLTRYWKDISFGNFITYGDVVGATDSTIFRSDPDTSVRPRQPFSCWGHSGGSAFFLNIMSKVDSVIDFADYDVNGNAIVDLVVFHIYGLAEDGNFQGTGGVSGLPTTYLSNDSTAPGQRILVSHGPVIWSPSPEAYVHERDWNQTDAEIQSYWETHNIAAHEVGHRIDGYTAHRAELGNYEPMGSQGGFVDPVSWVQGPTSPYNPGYRFMFEWVDPIQVDRPLFSYELADHLSTGAILKARAYTRTTNDEFFLALATTREKIWETFWPSSGVMIYHINPNESYTNEASRWIDMELSSGMYEWTAVLQEVDPAWNCQPAPCSVWVEQNTLIANTVSGKDSFQVNWVAGDPYPRTAFEGGHWGTRYNYYIEGDTFNSNSNPTSYAHSTAALQDIRTMVNLTVSDVDTAGGNCTITAWSRHWRGTVAENALWLDSVVVDSAVVVNAGVALTIWPGTKIVIDSGASITINGSLTAVGTSGDPIVFRAKDPGDRWSGLYVDGGSVTLDYVDLQDFIDYGIFTDAPDSVSLNHVNFDCDAMRLGGVGLRLWNAPTVTQYVKHTHVYNMAADSEAAGMYLYNCRVNFDSTIIEDCDWVNSYIKKVSGSFHACTFRDRTEFYAVYFNTPPNTPNFRCCEFTDLAPVSGNWPTTIYCWSGTTPSFGGEGDTGGEGVSNTIEDSSAYLMIMYGTLNYPVIDSYDPQQTFTYGGRNSWTQTAQNGKFFQRNPLHGSRFPCTEQYWDPAFSFAMFSPTDPWHWNYNPVARDDWGLCGGASGGGGGSSFDGGPLARVGETLDDGEDFDSVYAAACGFEAVDDFAAAQQLFRYVAELAPSQELRWNGLAHVVVCESFTVAGESWVPGLISDLIVDDGGYEARVLGERLRASYFQNRVEYASAIETCIDLLSSGLTYEDSIQVAIDLVGIQTSMESGGGSLDDAATGLIPPRLKAQDDEHAMEIERDLMALLNPRLERKSGSSNVPREFKLYPNHPNPFNPTTMIEFDLPVALRVTLKVYNSLGQEVATVTDEMLVAGHHIVPWDGKSTSGTDVATGVYICQVKAGVFTQTMKMVLMR